MSPILITLYAINVLLVALIIFITLALNTKSEGLGAAITGASDSYRGAVGVEEQKRQLLKTLCYSFVGVAFVIAIVTNFV